MLPPGLYEQVINTALNRELSEIPKARKSVAPIDKAEASKVLAQYHADVVQKGLENVVDNGGDISTQIGLANQIVDLIQSIIQEADFAALNIDQRAEQLLALLREQDPRLAVGKTATDLSRPETSIAQSSLFTGAIHDPDLTVHLTLFHATIQEGIPQKLEHNDIRWITVNEIDQYEFCPADMEIFRRIKDAY